MRLWRYQGANALGVCPQNPLFVARAMKTLRKVIRIRKKLENQNIHVYLQCLKKTRILIISNGITKTKKIIKNDWKPRFKCTFKVYYKDDHYAIGTTWFAATSNEAARKQAKKYLKENYGNNFEILSMSY